MSFTFFIQNYGCQLNASDSSGIRSLMLKAGFSQSPSSKDADIIILNTCAVRLNVELKPLHTIISHLKHHKLVILTGCSVYPDSILINTLKTFQHIPQIIVDSQHKHLIPTLVKKYLAGIPQLELINMNIKEYHFLPTPPYPHPYSVFITISHGCNHHCSYCIVPIARGKEVYKPIQQIISELKQLTENGAIEVTLLGQNVLSYKPSFTNLIEQIVSNVPQIKRIRFLSPHPAYFKESLVKSLAEFPQIVPHFHIPLQSGSNKILSLMRRGYTKEKFLRTVELLNKYFNNPSLTTDIMVGFPTETEEDFKDTLDVMKKVEFEQSFIFKYSPRPHTLAYTFPSVPDNVAQHRLEQALTLQDEITEKKLKAYIGSIQEVLFVKEAPRSNTMIVGQLFGHARVITNKKYNLLGKIVKVKITGLSGHTLEGTPFLLQNNLGANNTLISNK